MGVSRMALMSDNGPWVLAFALKYETLNCLVLLFSNTARIVLLLLSGNAKKNLNRNQHLTSCPTMDAKMQDANARWAKRNVFHCLETYSLQWWVTVPDILLSLCGFLFQIERVDGVAMLLKGAGHWRRKHTHHSDNKVELSFTHV